jgi:hypothetical protein
MKRLVFTASGGRCSFCEINHTIHATFVSRIGHNLPGEALNDALAVDRESRVVAATQIGKYRGRKSGSG